MPRSRGSRSSSATSLRLITKCSSLKDSPNRLNGLSGAAHAAQLAGDRQKARDYYLQIAKLLESAPAVAETR